MKYTLTILESHYRQLVDFIFSKPGLEGAAYLLCGQGTTKREYRFLVQEVVPVEDIHYLIRTPNTLSIDSGSYTKIAKKAKLNKQAVIFVHSHPEGFASFSPQDDIEESKLHNFLSDRLSDTKNGSLVFATRSYCKSRVWINKRWVEISRVRIIGKQFKFIEQMNDSIAIPEFFARQVLVFGPEIQKLLIRLHVGIVGAGGTGSALVEQLTRTGVGEISIFDGDSFEDSNINRVYGSKVSSKRRNKATIAGENAAGVGLGTTINVYPRDITNKSIAKELRNCDLVFCCTDNEWSRGVLVQLSIRYLIPLVDLAVMISSDGGIIRDIVGRVTTFFPGEACLFCRKRIDARTIQLETLSTDERKILAANRYAPELQTDDPAVIMFTTAVASQALSEFFHRLTGFMGENRNSTEVLMLFDTTRLRTNREAANSECLCQNTKKWGSGDSRDFLGITWPSKGKRKT